MRLLSITLMFVSINVFSMECATIKSLEEIKDLLEKHGKTIRDYEEQLPTNYAVVYRLRTGEVILTPGSLRPGYKCLLFASEECFRESVRKDSFPIENEMKDLYEYDLEGQRNIHENIGKYHEYLNKRLKLDHPSLDRGNMQEYYDRFWKIKKKTDEDMLALGAVMGELQRKELNGRWVLEKWYGTYNPYYKPMIVHSTDNRIESPYDTLMGMVKWREKDAGKFFFIPPMTPYPTLDKKKLGGREVIELQ